MKFYIASSLKNYKQVRELSRLLKRAGWEYTYDWTLYCQLKEINAETLKSIGEREYEGIKQSDVVIVLTPQGRGNTENIAEKLIGENESAIKQCIP